MNDKFEQFTERARKVLSLSQEEAQRFNHNYIGTEHLLLGLVREGDGVAAKVLDKLGVELEKARNAVEFIIGRGDRMVVGEVGLTPRAKKVIELAVDEARRLNHHYIGTEHILLGLVREGDGIAAGALESLGVNLEKVRRATIEVLSQGGPGSPSRAAEASYSSQPRARPDFGRFTERSRGIIKAAITEARERGQSEVGTGHMLLALTQADDDIAAQALQQSGVSLDAAQREVERTLGPRMPADAQPATGATGLDAHTLRMIALAADEAQQMGDVYVGTEHLLLGLIREGAGLGAQVLLTLGANLNQLRSLSMQLRSQAASARNKRPAVGQITLGCRDVGVTSAFYIERFGAEPVANAGAVAAGEPLPLQLPGGGPLLGLRTIAADTALATDAIELNLLVGDVDLVWRTLKDSNVAGLSEVSDSPHGRVFSVPDPDGRLLRVYAHGPQHAR
jgi:ATP-dependent Clp protease ATP-binding subunit ClpA